MEADKVGISKGSIKFYKRDNLNKRNIEVAKLTADSKGNIISGHNGRIKCVLDPVESTDVANKFYVDSLVYDHFHNFANPHKVTKRQLKITQKFTLSTNPIEVVDTNYTTVSHLPWFATDFKEYKNGKVMFRVVVSDRNLEVDLYNSTSDKVLGSLANISKSGFYSFPITNPIYNAGLELRVKKDIADGINPHIIGVILNFDY